MIISCSFRSLVNLVLTANSGVIFVVSSDFSFLSTRAFLISTEAVLGGNTFENCSLEKDEALYFA